MAEEDMTPEQIAQAQKDNCIFCKIAKKEVPAKIIYETDKIICVLDINPASEGHIIIFPKEHYMILPHIPIDISNEMFKVVRLMSKNLLKTLQCKGTNIFVANGMAAGQKAPHVMVHVFPRKEGDGLLEFESKNVDGTELDKLASQIKPYLPQVLGDKTSPVPQSRNTNVVSQAQNTAKKVEEENEDETFFEEQEPQDKKRTMVKPKKKTSNKEDKEFKSTQPKKMDLDEISKLFG